ncbi:MAG: hypothetical protein GFGODING_02546 [Flavobacteriales bacterium]|nr:hypothetical protein [Flavobacteriales bacterium]
MYGNEPKINPMRSTLRTLGAGLLTVLATAVLAQQSYTWNITGTIAGCTPGQAVIVQTVQGTQPPQNITAVVDQACHYSAFLLVTSSPAYVQVSTMCGGVNLTGWDSAVYNFFVDTVYSDIDLNCGGGPVDCLGVPNGTALPGTPCDDGDPMTGPDLWDANCNCVGGIIQACQASFTVQQLAPWQIGTTNTSTGLPPLTFEWWLPDGSTTNQPEPGFTFSSPGLYGICLTVVADGGNCTSYVCDTVLVDSTGTIGTGTYWYDCLGVFMGADVPGAPCDDGNPNTSGDVWSPTCVCAGQGGGPVDCLGIPGGTALPGTVCTDTLGGILFTGIWDTNCVCQSNVPVDCLGIPNGPNMPGTPCDDGDPLTLYSYWTWNCVCVADTSGQVYDCMGVLNGPAMPGTPCDDGNAMTYNDTWDGSCNCVGSGGLPCEADFIVTQAYDSLQGPIPGTIWVFFMNNGGQGFTYFWDFGDGTTSTAPFPTHTYSGNGPYLLCLTVSGFGCTDTYCDSVGVDSTGMILPMGVQSQGFTINVMGGSTTIDEVDPLDGLVLAPNPVNEVLALNWNSTRSGVLAVDVLDITGKVVHRQSARVQAGPNTLQMPLGHLEAGPYLLRLNVDGSIRTERFVRGY